ncbi:MAG: Gfo/Idh/MocA family protein [Thermoanaerobaculia bacterium]
MSEKVRIAILGTGSLGRTHARVLTEMPEVEVVGFVEPKDEAAAEVTAKLGLHRFQTLDELDGMIDAAVIASTTDMHGRIAEQLLLRGVDVMVEKPITADPAEARRIIALAAERGRLIQVGHVERYNPAILAAIPHIGRPRYVEADRLGAFSGRSLDIDVLLDLMIHDLQLVLSLLGSEVVAIHAVGIPVLTEKVDMANVRLELASGAVANLTASRVASERVRKFRLFGSNAYVSVDTREQEVHGYRLITGGDRPGIEPLDVSVEKKEPLRAELEAFVDCVRTRNRPLVAGEDGLAALELAIRVGEAIDHSVQAWESRRVTR